MFQMTDVDVFNRPISSHPRHHLLVLQFFLRASPAAGK
jgi:hypothetical protein